MSTKVVTAPASQAKRPVRSHKPAQQAEHQPAVTEDEARLAKDDSEQDVSVAPANEEETAPVESETSMAGEYTFGSALAEAAASSGSLISDAHRADEVGFGAFGDDDGSTPLLLAAVGLAALGLIFIVSDSGGDDEVVPVNRAPTITAPAAATTAEDTAVTLTAPTTADADGDTVTVTATATNGTIAKNAAGAWVFTPAANFNGTAVITYSATDGKTGTVPTTATQNVTVTAVPDNPTITATTPAAIDEDSTAGATITVTAADADAGQTVTTAATVAAAQGTVTKNADGTFKFVPAANFNGTAVITITATDSGTPAGTATTTVNVVVNPVNDPATLTPTAATVAEDTALNLSDLITVTDVDGPAASVAAAVSTQPTNGTITIVGGDVIYTPNANFFGSDSVGITLTDAGTPGSATSTFTIAITVTDVPEGPVVTPFSIDIGTGSVAIVKDAGTASFNFTDNSEATTNVEITNFTNNDKITVTNAVSTDYNFSRDLLNDINDLVITYTDPGTGATNRIYIQDVLPDTGPVNSLASATTAMGFTFMTFA
jgi:hypothetical protein